MPSALRCSLRRIRCRGAAPFLWFWRLCLRPLGLPIACQKPEPPPPCIRHWRQSAPVPRSGISSLRTLCRKCMRICLGGMSPAPSTLQSVLLCVHCRGSTPTTPFCRGAAPTTPLGPLAPGPVTQMHPHLLGRDGPYPSALQRVLLCVHCRGAAPATPFCRGSAPTTPLRDFIPENPLSQMHAHLLGRDEPCPVYAAERIALRPLQGFHPYDPFLQGRRPYDPAGAIGPRPRNANASAFAWEGWALPVCAAACIALRPLQGCCPCDPFLQGLRPYDPAQGFHP